MRKTLNGTINDRENFTLEFAQSYVWNKVYLICPEEKITAAKRCVRDLDANLHSLRRIHLHILHYQLTFWFPRHGSFTMYKNELRMLQNPNPWTPMPSKNGGKILIRVPSQSLNKKNARSPSAFLWSNHPPYLRLNLKGPSHYKGGRGYG